MKFNNNRTDESASIIALAGLNILDTTSNSLLNILIKNRREDVKTILFFANSNFIVNCRELFKQFADVLNNIILANDGVALNIAAKLVHGRKFRENLNGTDFSPYFLSHFPETLKIYLLGAKPEVVVRTKEYLTQNFPRHIVVGYQDGYFDRNNSNLIVDNVNQSGADILFVAMGNPIQEQWILQNQMELNVSYVFGVGALFDFWSGNKIRAPIIVQRLRLEWLFRLCQEPRRLFKRYTIDMFKFLYVVIKYSGKNHQ